MLSNVQTMNGSLTFFSVSYISLVFYADMWLRPPLCKPYLDRGQALVLAGWFSHKTFSTHIHTRTQTEPRLHSLLFLMQLEA